MAEKQEIHAVHVEDQEELLERLGLLDAFRDGELKCRGCDRPVSQYGLGLVQMSDENEIEVACADSRCGDRNEAP